jgi:peptide/nickel transport system substrate-binding protein/oligopeptide transport system substrate-binding protein
LRGLRLQSSAPYVNYSQLGKQEGAAAVVDEATAGGGTIQVPIAGAVNTLDPALASTVEQVEVVPCVFETLTRDVGGRIIPWLAAEYRMEEGGKRYRFRLRDDVRFHDGRRLTARDVRYSFEQLLQNPESECRWFYSTIRGAKALLRAQAGDLAGFRIHSATDFTIELDEVVSFFPALISYVGASIVPEGNQRFGRDWQEGCVGTGPFRVVKFEPGRVLELERNRAYWREGYPRSDGLVFSFGVSPSEILSGFRGGRFALASDLIPGEVEALRRNPDFASSYRETPRLMTYYAAFNTHHGPLSDRQLRLRLARSVDVPALVRQTLGRLAVPATGLIPPGLLGHDSAFRAVDDQPKAGSMDRPAAEIEVTAALNPVFFGEYAGLALEISRVFREKGVKVRPTNKTIAEWLDAAGQGSVDMVIGRWNADYPDANTFAGILHSQEGLLGRLCGSPEMDRLIERGRGETSPAARHSIYRQIEDIITREALLLPLFHEQTYRFARPEVEGLSLSYSVTAVDYSNLRIRG